MISVSTVIKKGNMPKQVSKLKRLTREGLIAALEESVLKVHLDVVNSIQKKSKGSKKNFNFAKNIRSGPRYNAGRKRNVIVSPPGGAPNTDLGSLANSYSFEINRKKLTGIVGSSEEKAAHLEFGTKDMLARPHLRPAVEKNKKKISKLFKTKVKSKIKKVKKVK